MTTGHDEQDPVSQAAKGAAAEASSPVRAMPLSREQFDVAFDRWFDRIYTYVSKRVDDGATRERVVREILSTHLHLLVDAVDEKQIAGRLKSASDRRIKQEVAGRLSSRAVGSS